MIEDDVEIGANSTVDRGALEETRIRRGTKIDNLVHMGHNCDIGEHVIWSRLRVFRDRARWAEEPCWPGRSALATMCALVPV